MGKEGGGMTSRTIPGHRLECEIADGVARLTMAAPAVRNAIDLGWCRSFAHAARECTADGSVRVIVLAAQGDVFSVGGDLDYFISARGRIRAEAYEMTQLFHAGLQRLVQARAPVVTAIRGMAAGGGFSLAMSGDLVVASRKARFVTAYSRSGLTPDGGLSWWLPRVVGARKAFELLALNETLDADQALSLGLITRVFDDSDFESGLASVVAQLASMSPVALGGLKRLMASSPSNSLAEQFDDESAVMADTLDRPETQAMLDAFLARRQAKVR
jgi:2-(1,2-epoxy-1,2-dihydrophenyl)acetyl-CoA isomerase